MHEKGVVSALVVLMHEHTGALVYQDHIFVLINDIERRLYAVECAAVVLGRAEKFIAYKKLYLVALGKHRVRLCAAAVQLDLFRSYRLVHHRLRQPLHRLGEEFVKPLTSVVFSYCENLHFLHKRVSRLGATPLKMYGSLRHGRQKPIRVAVTVRFCGTARLREEAVVQSATAP